MPPALSENGSSDIEDEVPAVKQGGGKGKAKAKGKGKGKGNGKHAQIKPAEPEVQDADEEEEDDSEVGEGEYVVEAIHGHRFSKGVLQFNVKWEGYENPKDRTWETEDNMETAADVLKEYFESIGGRPEATGQKRKGRKSNAGGVKSESGTPAASAKRVKAEKEWSPPPGSWEHDVDHVDNVEETMDPVTGKPERFAYLVWKKHQKTQHPLKHVYQKCPQKMLEYYESHLVFTVTDPADAEYEARNGEDKDNDVSMKGY